jgi:iron complex outermembrane receptor protein
MPTSIPRRTLFAPRIRAGLIAGVAVAAVSTANARAESAPAAPSAAPAAAAVDEVVVTAQRRVQRIQDVGIAVTALDAKAIANLNLKDSTDLTKAVPSLRMNAYTPSAVVFNIRGISQNDFGDEQEPPVAVYQDDGYASSFIASGFPIFDQQRIEVLRGPQGTLFGRNATGGAIQFISAKPTKSFQGYLTLQTGSYGEWLEEGALSGPLADTVQMRLSGMHDWADGYLTNIYPGQPSRGGENHYALRDIIDWQPTGNTNVELNVKYARTPHENSAGMYSWEAAYPNAQGQGVYLPANQVNPLLLLGYNAAFPGPNYPTGTDLTGYSNSAISAPRGGDPWKIATVGLPSFTDRTLFGSTLKVEAPAGPFHLTSITDYQSDAKDYQENASASPNDQVNFLQGAHVSQYSQEVRAAGHFGDHELVLGAFGMSINGHYTASYAFPSLFDLVPDVRFSQRTTSFAAFGQDEWTLPNNFKAILGVRVWHDERKVAYTATDNTGETIIFNTSQITAIDGATGSSALQGVTVTPGDADKQFGDYALRAELDYKPDRNTLIYASFNRGSKSGGFTLSTATPTAGYEKDFLNGIPYKPEVLNSVEGGVKSTLPLRTTLNADVFYYNYQNYQAFAEYGLVETVVNRAAYEAGVELEGATHPIDGLTLSGNATYMNNKVRNVPLPDGEIVDRHFPQAPDASIDLLARYDWYEPIGDFFLQADSQWSSKFCFSVLCAPVEHEPAHIIGNGRIGYIPPNKRWDVAFYVNNIGQEVYRVYTFDVASYTGQIPSVYAKPRTWGLTATYHFGS